MTWLTRRGAAAALAVGLATTWGMGWRGVLLLFAFFISSSLLTTPKGGAGRRNERQVLANGGVAALAALLGNWPAFAGALAAATADTWATEIGSRSRTQPRLITSGAPVPAGTSGGITLLGTVGGIAGAAFIGTLAGLVTVGIAGVVGMVFDSVLGATMQGKFECPRCGARTEQAGTVCHEPVRAARGVAWLDNDAVNLAATFAGALLAHFSSLCC